MIPRLLNFMWLTLSMKVEQKECSETSAHNIKTLGNCPNERIHYSEYGEILVSRICNFINLGNSPIIRKYISVKLGRCNRINFNIKGNFVGRVAQSVWQLAMGWTVRGSDPGGGEIFRTYPDRPWGPPSLLYNGYRFFPGGKERPGRDADPSPPSSAVGHERVELHLYFPYGPYGVYRASVPVQWCTLVIKGNFSTKIVITEKLLFCNFRLIVTFICVEDICTLNRNAYSKLEVGQKWKKTVTGM